MLVAYGHSWIDGDGASGPERNLVSLAAARLGLAAVNRGVGGSRSGETAALVDADPPPPAARAVLLMTGLNDSRFSGTAEAALAAYAEALDVILTAVRHAAPLAAVVAVEQPHLVDYSLHSPYDNGSDAVLDAYNGVLRRIAATHHGVDVVRVLGWDPLTMLSEDTVHPNDLGHAEIAAAVAEHLGRRMSVPGPVDGGWMRPH